MSSHNDIVTVTFDRAELNHWALMKSPRSSSAASQTVRNIANAAPVDTERLHRSFKYRLPGQDGRFAVRSQERIIGVSWSTGRTYIPRDSFICPS